MQFSKGESAALDAFYIELTARWPECDTVPEDKEGDFDSRLSSNQDKSGMHLIMPASGQEAEDVASCL